MNDVQKQVEELKQEVEKLKKKQIPKWFYPFLVIVTAIVAWYSPQFVRAVVDDLITYYSGDLITADDMNTNLKTLANQIDSNTSNINTHKDLLFPDGTSGNNITVTINDVTSYTVTTGKVLFITSINSHTGATALQIQYSDGTAYADFLNITSISPYVMSSPIIVAGGKGIKASTAVNLTVTGFEVEASVTPFHIRIDNSNYTISNDKTAYLLTVYNTFGGANDLQNSNNINIKYVSYGVATSKILDSPIIIAPGTTLIATNNSFYINGYLK